MAAAAEKMREKERKQDFGCEFLGFNRQEDD